MKSKLSYFAKAHFLLALALPFGLAAKPTPEETKEPAVLSSEVIKLDSYEVKGRRLLPNVQLLWALRPKPWQYARVGEFEVLSKAWEGNADRYLQYFQRFRDALQVAWPVPMPALSETTIIICGAENKFADFTTEEDKQRNGVFSHLFRDREKASIVIDTQKSFYDSRIQQQFVRLEIDPRRLLYREYARLLYSQSEPPPPPWLIEGNTQIIMDMEIYENTIRFGYLDGRRGAPDPEDIPDTALLVESEPIYGETASDDKEGQTYTLESVLPYWNADPAFHVALANQPLLSLEEMFSVTADQYAKLNPLVDMLWAKQAHAFVHYCKFGANRKYDQPFQEFITRIASESLTEELFVECFQMSYDDMLEKLRGYIKAPYYKTDYIKLYKDQGLESEKVKFRLATPNEIGRIVGNAQFLAGKREEAIATYQNQIEEMTQLTDEPDAELLASLGIAKLENGQREDALKLLLAAAELDTKSPTAWTTLARMRLEKLKTSLPPDRKFTPDQMAGILVPLLKSRKLSPPIPATYSIMAEAWEHSQIPPNLMQIDLISEGIVRFPNHVKLALRVARLYARAQDFEQAKKCAEIGLRHSSDEFTRSQLENFLSKLPAAPPIETQPKKAG